MASLSEAKIDLETREAIELVNITDPVVREVERSGVKEGMVLVMSRHTTGAVVINEDCAELQKDMVEFLREIAPAGKGYRHDRVAVDGRPNAHSHLMNLLLTQQVTLPLIGGRLQLGTWQKIFFVELDGPRKERRVTVVIAS